VSAMLSNGQMLPKDQDRARVWLGRMARERSKKSRRIATPANIIAAIAIIVAIVSSIITHRDAVKALFH